MTQKYDFDFRGLEELKKRPNRELAVLAGAGIGFISSIDPAAPLTPVDYDMEFSGSSFVIIELSYE